MRCGRMTPGNVRKFRRWCDAQRKCELHTLLRKTGEKRHQASLGEEAEETREEINQSNNAPSHNKLLARKLHKHNFSFRFDSLGGLRCGLRVVDWTAWRGKDRAGERGANISFNFTLSGRPSPGRALAVPPSSRILAIWHSYTEKGRFRIKRNKSALSADGAVVVSSRLTAVGRALTGIVLGPMGSQESLRVPDPE